jgi:hypothetical protein
MACRIVPRTVHGQRKSASFTGIIRSSADAGK